MKVAANSPLYSLAISDVLVCPLCDHKLLCPPDGTLECSECQGRWSVAEPFLRRWDKPASEIPNYVTVVTPAGWFIVGAALFCPYWFWGRSGGDANSTGSLICAGLATLCCLAWIFYLHRAWRAFGHYKGLVLSLMAHVVIASYLSVAFGVILILSSIAINPLGSEFSEADTIRLLINVNFGSAVLVLVGFGSKRLEHFLTRCCISDDVRRCVASGESKVVLVKQAALNPAVDDEGKDSWKIPPYMVLLLAVIAMECLILFNAH